MAGPDVRSRRPVFAMYPTKAPGLGKIFRAPVLLCLRKSRALRTVAAVVPVAAAAVLLTMMLAAVVLSVIPPAIVYITCQKFLLQGVITSGLKS